MVALSGSFLTVRLPSVCDIFTCELHVNGYRRVTGRLSYRQAAAALFEVSANLAVLGRPGPATMRRWRRGFAVYVRVAEDETNMP